MLRKDIFFVFVLFTGVIFSQISVKSFRELPQDIEARVNPKEFDGEKCALIKVVTNYKNFEFDAGGGVICDVQERTAEIFVYVNEDTRYLTIKHPRLGVLRRYRIKVKKLNTYEMVLQTAKLTTIVEETVNTQWVVINSQPTGAKVFINGNDTGKTTPYQAELMLGKHYYRLERTGYKPQSGKFVLKDKKQEIDIVLLSNYADITFKTEPFVNAEIKINGSLINKTTPATMRLGTGNYVVQMTHPQYYTTKKVVMVEAEKNKEEVFKMRPKNGHLRIVTEPFGAEIYIDEKSYGTTPQTIKNVLIGSRLLTFIKKGYKILKKSVIIKEGQITDVKLKLIEKESQIHQNNVYNNDYKQNTSESQQEPEPETNVKNTLDSGFGLKYAIRQDLSNRYNVFSAFYQWNYFMIEVEWMKPHKINISNRIRDRIDNRSESMLAHILETEKDKTFYRDVRTVTAYQLNLIGRVPIFKSFYWMYGAGFGMYKTKYKHSEKKVKNNYNHYYRSSHHHRSSRYFRATSPNDDVTITLVKKEKEFQNFKAELHTGFQWYWGRHWFLEGKFITIAYRDYQSSFNLHRPTKTSEVFTSINYQLGIGFRF